MELQHLWAEAQRRLKAANSLVDQTAVHRKKFEFIFSQLKTLFSHFSKVINQCLDNKENRACMTNIINELHDLNNLVSMNTLQAWSDTTINNCCNFVMNSLIDISTEIYKNVKSINPDAAKFIEPEAPEWDTNNIIDLMAIHSSFKQFLSLDKLDPLFAQRVKSKLESIDKELEQADTNKIAEFSPIPERYKQWIVNLDDFVEEKEIGGGVSAVVSYGRNKKTGQEVAIKKFKFRRLNGSRLQSFQREVAVLALANHPTLLKLVGVTDKLPFCIIMEWMPNHSLYHDLHVYHHLDATGKTIALFDIARGMQFLHSRQIVHRDLKSLNVLLDENDRAKICDFGFSRHASDATLMQQSIGTPHWMAPEVLKRNSHYTSKIDVYAFGVLAWEVATGQVPYSGMDSHTIIQQVINNDIRPPLPPDLNPSIRDLITMCWERDPVLRPTFDVIVQLMSTGNILIDGANQEEFKEYVASKAIGEEQIMKKVRTTIESMKNGDKEFNNGLKKLRETGIPPALLKEAWKLTEVAPRDDLPYFVSLFFGTSYKGQAAAILRTFNHGEVPQNIASMLVEELPTGDENVDMDIVITACKNGAADLIAIYSTQPKELALAFDVASLEGVEISLKAAVIDCCVKSLSLNEDYLTAAAVRCLISLDSATRVHKPCLQYMLQCGNIQLRSLAFIAMAAGKRTDKELVKQSFLNWNTDKFAFLHVIAVADEDNCSSLIIDDIKKRKEPLSTQDFRCIFKLANKTENAASLIEIINKRGFSASSEEETKAYSLLKAKLNIV